MLQPHSLLDSWFGSLRKYAQGKSLDLGNIQRRVGKRMERKEADEIHRAGYLGDFSLQESSKPSLFEVAVCRQRLCDVTSLHYRKTRAVNQAPFLILAFFKQLPTFQM